MVIILLKSVLIVSSCVAARCSHQRIYPGHPHFPWLRARWGHRVHPATHRPDWQLPRVCRYLNLSLNQQEIHVDSHLLLDCKQAQSASMDYTRLLDGGLNYCNLYDLLKGECTETGWPHDELVLCDTSSLSFMRYCKWCTQSQSVLRKTLFIPASGLNLSPGFLEMTNEWACLGYVFAPCKT